MAMMINTIAGNLATVSEGNPNASAKFSSEVLLQGVSTLAVAATLKYSCSTAAEIMLAFVFYKEPNLLVHRSGKYTPVSAGTNAQITVTDTLTLPEELDALPDGSNFGVIIFAYIFSGTEQASVRVTNFTEYTNGEITKTLYKYSTPQVSGLSLRRCNADGTNNEEGTRVKFNFSGAVSPVGNQNTKELVIKYRESGAPTWAQETINITALGYNMSISDKVLSATFAQHKEYEIQAVLTDKLISTVNTKRVGTAFSLMHFSGDKTQIAFGKYCETGGPGMDVGLTARFRNTVQFDNPAAVREALGISAMTLGFNASTGTFPGGSGSTDADNAIAPFDKVIASKGGGLTFDAENHGVVIGPGISHVEASGQTFFYDGFTDNITRRTVIALDGVTVQAGWARTAGSPYMCISVPPVIVPVSEGQVITLGCRSNSGNAGKIDIRHTYLTVKVI